MARKNTIRLLLINGSDNDSELMVSLFRSAGRVARAQRVDSAGALEQALQQSWDLLIADDNHPELKVEDVLAQLQQAKIDFPVLVLRDTAEINALFAAGARDVISPADDQRLLCAAQRELETIELERSVIRLRRQVQEAEQRNQVLLGEADQAIAYVADGMVINANALFAERFGYGAADELDCVPIVDLISATDQDGFKTALKNGIEAEFNGSGQHSDGTAFPAEIRLLNSTYDGDPCAQLIVSSPQAGAAADNDHDSDTGLFSRSYLLEQMQTRGSGWLCAIEIDRFAELRSELGLCESIALTAAVASFIASGNILGAVCHARIADGGFAALIDGGDGMRAQELARVLCKAAAAHDFEQPVTLTIGIAPVGRVDAEAALDQAFGAMDTARAGAGDERVHLQREETGTAAARQQPNIGAPLYALDDALEEQRFALLFQPIISLRGASGEHYEVLLRMRGATDTLELPDNFIASIGIGAANAKLDRWILLEATKQLAANRAHANDTRLLINLTANALQDETLISWLGVALKAAGLPPASLILQLREIDVVNDLKAAKTFAEAIRQLGCRFAVSGFGRMAEPQKMLSSLPADMVQLDASFTRSLHTNGDAQALKTLVAAVGAEAVKTIVPFVENASVLATLWQVGADFIQGHYLQAPSREMNYEFTDIA